MRKFATVRDLIKMGQVPFKATAAGRMQASQRAMGGLQKQLSGGGGLFGQKQQSTKGMLAGTATPGQQRREGELGQMGQFSKGKVQGMKAPEIKPQTSKPVVPGAPAGGGAPARPLAGPTKPVSPTSPATPGAPGAAKVTGGGIKPGFAAKQQKYNPFGKQTAGSLGIPGASPF